MESSLNYQSVSVSSPHKQERVSNKNSRSCNPIWARSAGALLFVAVVGVAAGALYIRSVSSSADSEEISLPHLTQQNGIFYGDQVSLQNGWQSWQGGFLDTKENASKCVADKFCVSTADTTNRHLNSGIWVIESASGKNDGSPVMNGDIVHFRNLYNGFGGYLDVNGRGCTGSQDHFCVSTSNSKNRHNYSGTWKIKATESWVQEITSFTAMNIENQYSGYQGIRGGYLDVNGNGCQGNLHCVSTSVGPTRHLGSTFWRIFKNPIV